MISLFFLAIMTPGFFLNRIVGTLKEKTKFYSFLSIGIGLALIWISPKEWVIAPGCILVGLGYGVIQPVVYNQTTHTAISRKVTLALAFVMTMNYLAILLCPFIIDFFQSTVFHIKSQQFAFVFNLCISIVMLVISYTKRNSFLFNDNLK